MFGRLRWLYCLWVDGGCGFRVVYNPSWELDEYTRVCASACVIAIDYTDYTIPFIRISSYSSHYAFTLRVHTTLRPIHTRHTRHSRRRRRLRTRPPKNLHKALAIPKGIVQGCRRHTHHVRLALVHHDAFPFQHDQHVLEEARRETETQLGAALVRVRGRDDGVVVVERMDEEGLEVASEFSGACAQGRHGGAVEDGQGGEEGGEIEGRGIADLEAAGAGDRGEDVVHGEAGGLGAAPPALQASVVRGGRGVAVGDRAVGVGGVRVRCVAFVDEEAADRPGARVDVLVVAPGGEVDVPFVEGERDVADRVGEIPPDFYAVVLGVGGDGGHVEVLACVELDAREEEDSEGGGVRIDLGEDMFQG